MSKVSTVSTVSTVFIDSTVPKVSSVSNVLNVSNVAVSTVSDGHELLYRNARGLSGFDLQCFRFSLPSFVSPNSNLYVYTNADGDYIYRAFWFTVTVKLSIFRTGPVIIRGSILLGFIKYGFE